MRRLLLLLSILLLAFPAAAWADVGVPPEGTMNTVSGKTFHIGPTVNQTTTTTDTVTDGDTSTRVRIPARNFAWISIPSTKVHSFRYWGSANGYVMDVYFYDAAGKLLRKIDGSMATWNGKLNEVNLDGVAKIAFENVYSTNSDAYAVYLNEVEIYKGDDEPPSPPTGLLAEPGVGSVTLSWNPNPESDVDGYFVYKNGERVFESPIRGTSAVIEGLEAGKLYALQVSAIDVSKNESGKSAVLNAAPVGPPIAPTLAYTNLASTSVRLTWDAVGNSYSVYQGETLLTKGRLYTFFDVTGLQPETEYTFKVVSLDRFGRSIESNVVTIRTTKPELTSPAVTVKEIDHDSFRVIWNPVQFAQSYKVFVDGNEVYSGIGTFYEVTGLQPNTLYKIKVVATAEGLEPKQTEVSATTLAAPRPKVTGASVSTISGQPSKRELSYTTNGMVSAVKVYVGGQLIGEYPVEQDKIEIDLSDIEGSFADVRIEPVEPDGEGYDMKIPALTTGIDAIDSIIAKLLDAFGLSRSGFVYLALAAIPVTLIVLLYFWLRGKYKGIFGNVAAQKGEMKPSKAAAVRQANKDKFDPDPPRQIFRGRRKKRGFLMNEATPSQNQFNHLGSQAESVRKPAKRVFSFRGNAMEIRPGRQLGGRFIPPIKFGPGARRVSNVGSRASPRYRVPHERFKSQLATYKGRQYNLGARGDYKPFRGNPRGNRRR